MTETIALHELISHRWSPRGFSSRFVEPSDLQALFEAARWASSCFNEQPWRFIVASKADPEQFNRILGLLVEKNREWAQTAGALAISTGKRTFTHNGAPNRFGLHDAGAALAQLSLEAVARGLRVHAMGGFDAARARTEFGIPDDFEVGAAFAIGYPEGDPYAKPATHANRTRKPLEELVFSGAWGTPAPF